MTPHHYWYMGFAAIALLSMGGCAINEQVRTPSTPNASTYLGKREEQLRMQRGKNAYDNIEYYSIKSPNAPNHYSHTTAYIEFDEQGDFFDRGQLLSALNAAPKGPKRLLIFYAHGWQNNTRSRDVLLFNQFLSHLARTLNEPPKPGMALATPPWEVYGVYLSWRGTTYNPVDYVNPRHETLQDIQTEADAFRNESEDPVTNDATTLVKYFTFWSRKTAAARFAGGPLLETIQTISDKIRSGNVNDSKKVLTRTIIMGHSFGAYIVEKTLVQSLPSQEILGKHYILPPADLVVLLNSAAPAIYAKEFIEYLKWHSVGDKEKPFIVSITSEADTATKLAFPAGTVPGTLFDVGSYQGKGSISFQGAHEKSFFTHTPGHCDYIISHDVVPDGPIRDDFDSGKQENAWIFKGNLFANTPRAVPNFTPLAGNQVALWGDGGYGKTGALSHPQIWTIQRSTKAEDQPSWAEPYNDTTYWILRVPKQIIADHGDVWNPNTASLLAGLFRMSGMLPEADPKHPGNYTEQSYRLRSLATHDLADPGENYLTKCAPYPSEGDFY